MQNSTAAAHLTTVQSDTYQKANGSGSGPVGKSYICNRKIALISENNSVTKNELNWVIDYGATDHMTHSKSDISCLKASTKTGIINANGDIYPVEGMGHTPVSEKMTLRDTLLVPSLSTRLISMGKITKDLNCAVLMYSDFCVFQDLLTGEIIGRGFKRERLYYLDYSTLGKQKCGDTYNYSLNKQAQ